MSCLSCGLWARQGTLWQKCLPVGTRVQGSPGEHPVTSCLVTRRLFLLHWLHWHEGHSAPNSGKPCRMEAIGIWVEPSLGARFGFTHTKIKSSLRTHVMVGVVGPLHPEPFPLWQPRSRFWKCYVAFQIQFCLIVISLEDPYHGVKNSICCYQSST